MMNHIHRPLTCCELRVIIWAGHLSSSYKTRGILPHILDNRLNSNDSNTDKAQVRN